MHRALRSRDVVSQQIVYVTDGIGIENVPERLKPDATKRRNRIATQTLIELRALAGLQLVHEAFASPPSPPVRMETG